MRSLPSVLTIAGTGTGFFFFFLFFFLQVATTEATPLPVTEECVWEERGCTDNPCFFKYQRKDNTCEEIRDRQSQCPEGSTSRKDCPCVVTKILQNCRDTCKEYISACAPSVTKPPTPYPTVSAYPTFFSNPNALPSTLLPPTTSPSLTKSPTSPPSTLLPPTTSSTLQEEIIKDMMPPSSRRCSKTAAGTSFEWPQAASDWNIKYAGLEEDVFLATMEHADDDSNRSWKIRFGQGGNIYSFVGPMGETVPAQYGTSPWTTQVWQVGTGGVSKSRPGERYLVYEAGNFDGTKPFYSPTLGSYCNSNDGECGFASWGVTNTELEKSDIFYLNRYINCGSGVFEYTTLRHNAVGSGVTFNTVDVPYGNTRESVLGDVVRTTADDKQELVYPLPRDGNGVGFQFTPLTDTGGFTIFAEDLPKNTNPLNGTQYEIPLGLDLTIGDVCYCRNNCRSTLDFIICPLADPNQKIRKPGVQYPGLVVELRVIDVGSVIAGVYFWAFNGKLCFFRGDLTLSKVQQILAPGSTVDVFHYYPSGKPEADNLALGHVHGNLVIDLNLGASTDYPKVFYQGNSYDNTLYRIVDNPTLEPGSTYFYRQYFMMGAYPDMSPTGKLYRYQVIKATKTVGEIEGREVTLHALIDSDAREVFGHTIGDAACQGDGTVAICIGRTTPQENLKPLFEIRCGSTSVVTNNLYHFTPGSGPPYRPYLCEGLSPDERPVWTILGYFPVDSCGAIKTYSYESSLC